MKQTMKTKMTLLLIAALLLFAAIGCVPEAKLSAAQTVFSAAFDAEETAANPASAAAYYENADKKTAEAPMDKAVKALKDEEVMQLFWELMDRAKQAKVADDYDAFAALHDATDTSVIESNYRINWARFDDYDKRDGFIIGEKDDYYWISYTYYTVAGIHPNTRRSSYDGDVLAREQDGRLLFSYGEQAMSIMSAYSETLMWDFFEQQTGEDRASMTATPNCTLFGNSQMFMNSNAVYDGSYDTNLIMLWQKENGDVCAMVWYANGTDQNIGVYRTALTITDDNLGTVAKASFDDAVTILAHHSSVRVFTIPASEVQSGTKAWGAMHCDCGTNY